MQVQGASRCNGSVTELATHSAGFYRCRGKRCFDVIVSGLILVLISPVLLFISLIVKLTSPGPVLYRQARVGQGGRVFGILKFRSMVVDADCKGPGITVSGDARVTATGKILRKLKLDEIPQLWNVVIGDMSLVGPRPELPKYVDTYDQWQRAVLSVRPGITDSASIKYRWEEELLSQSSAPEKFYEQIVLPKKLELNLLYIKQMSFQHDCSLLIQTVFSVMTPRQK